MSDPLPPSAAPPLTRGENRVSPPWAAGGRSHAIFQSSQPLIAPLVRERPQACMDNPADRSDNTRRAL
jgi:hypothetical protein